MHPRLLLTFFLLTAWHVSAQSMLDVIGITDLRALDPTLTGLGVPVALAEADVDGGTPDAFQVNPAAVGQPSSLFTYYSYGAPGGVTNDPPPNAAGTESAHANDVGRIFFGTAAGVAPGVESVDNYDASFFNNEIIESGVGIRASVVNQSFILSGLSVANRAIVEQAYDNYVATYGTVIVSGAGNGGAVAAPAGAYNVISVGAYGGSSSVGPTTDGRSKPDIVAPASATSYSTPEVAGAAAILIQAGERGDGGSQIDKATDVRTIKALLLNGAEKPVDWTHTSTQPLDLRYGAGVLNVYQSYQQLDAGNFSPQNNFSKSIPSGPPINSLLGWNMASILATRVHHYVFDLTGGPGVTFTLTSTLTWLRGDGQASINNLDLVLLRETDGNPVEQDQSVSLVDNVEHIHIEGLLPGRYDIQIRNGGGVPGDLNESYGFAFQFAAVPEPGSIYLVSLGVAMILFRRHRGCHIRPRSL
jgi:hypothetical protein